MTEVSIAAAIAAGALSFLSPCVLALLPVYLAFLGNAAAGLRGDRSPELSATRAAVLPQAIGFIAGFSVLFIVLGTSIGLIGAPLFRIPEARQAAGIAVIVPRRADDRRLRPRPRPLPHRDRPRHRCRRRGRSAPLALGALVAVGWTPCIGPVLGAIFTMGASSGSAPVVACS
jgi:cytochrome c-type biogenesis protein